MQLKIEIDKKTIGRRLKTARESFGLTQEKLSEEMGCTSKYISKVENGASAPSLPFVIKFSEITGSDLNYLLRGMYPKGESTAMHDEDDGRFRIRYNILGSHNFVIDGKEIYEQDLPHPNRRAWIIMLYMVLHKRPVDQQKLIADNWPDEEVDTARNNMRQAIFRLHNDLAAYHDVKVIDTRSRMMDFSGEVNVTTDADEMEDLYNRAKNLPDGDDKIILLKKAFELYRGRLFIQGEDDIGTWLYTYTTHYNQVYVDLTSALLTTLGHIKDYRCIMDYGPRALEIEPGILTAYYWIIIAADETGNSVAREKFLQKASEDLIDEENEKLKKLLALQNHMN